jgi:hypothetical protein
MKIKKFHFNYFFMKKRFKIISLITSLALLAAPALSEASLVGSTNNAVISLSPNTGVYRTNASFPIDILLNTHGQNVVVVAAYINYNPSLFQVLSIDTSNSIFTTEAEKTIDQSNGTVKITMGIPTPGVNVTSGRVATLNIQGLSNTVPGADNFNFDFSAGSSIDSNVILNDGLGTDVLSGTDNGRYSLDGTPPANVSGFTATGGEGSVTLNWTNPSTDFSGVKILRKTGSFPSNSTDGTVIYDSNGTSFIDTGLTNNITYYYGAFSRDIVLNYSSGAQASASSRNTTPPSAISNLSATPLTSRTIRLNWTSVGDDGTSGTASSYDIRYSSSAITASNFASAAQAGSAPSPKISGSAETLTVASLSSNTNYYFAIKASDSSGNISSISNIATARTFKAADLNNDSLVNSVDFGIIKSFWNNTSRPAADMNQDGMVNSVDFGIMMSQWG